MGQVVQEMGPGARPLYPDPNWIRGAAPVFVPPSPPFPPTPRFLKKLPKSLGPFPMSEYSHPIYQSLRLDHFETPRHVLDLIRDSELLRYIKTHKLII